MAQGFSFLLPWGTLLQLHSNSFSYGPWHVSSSSLSHETAFGSAACTTALTSFSNSSSCSLAVHSVWLSTLVSRILSGSGCLVVDRFTGLCARLLSSHVTELKTNSHSFNSEWGSGFVAGEQGHQAFVVSVYLERFSETREVDLVAIGEHASFNSFRLFL